MQTFEVQVGRRMTTSGWEWFLVVNGEQVRTNAAGTGYFSPDHVTPAQALPRLVAGMLRAGEVLP